MVEKCIVEIQGTFLVKIRNDAFNGNDGENAYEHINKFLEIVGLIKINGLTQDRFRLLFLSQELHMNGSQRSVYAQSLLGITCLKSIPRIQLIDTDLFTYDIQNFKTYDEYKRELNDDKAKGTEKPWLKNGVPYQLCDHICEPYHFKNGGTKWPTCTSDIDGFCNGGELPGMVRVGSMTYFQDHKWYDELVDGKLKDETLVLKTKIEGSWEDATLGVVKFCKWLKGCFENFHKLEYEVLANNPYLDINCTFGRDYEASNAGCTQENQEHKGDPIPEPSNCKVRRFEMMKYSFNDDEEYITIKESEYLNHSKDCLDAYRELLRLIDEGSVVTTPDK
ncbi:hypothetical protein Tco_1187179 [Tanacetum coccineum]